MQPSFNRNGLVHSFLAVSVYLTSVTICYLLLLNEDKRNATSLAVGDKFIYQIYLCELRDRRRWAGNCIRSLEDDSSPSLDAGKNQVTVK